MTTPTSDADAGTGSSSVDFQPGRAFATLLGNLPGMVYRCRNDPEWSMEFASSAALELTGYEPAALIDNRELAYADLIHHEDRDRVWIEVQRALEARTPFQLDYRILSKDGQLKWVWEQGCGVFDASGQVVALEGYICDVTRYRERSSSGCSRPPSSRRWGASPAASLTTSTTSCASCWFRRS